DTQSAVILERAFSHPALPDHLGQQRHEIVANVRQWASWLYYASGDVEGGKRTLDQAFLLWRDTVAAQSWGLEEAIWTSALQPTVDDPVHYVNAVLDNLPDTLATYRSRRGEILSKVLIGVAARRYVAGTPEVARLCL